MEWHRVVFVNFESQRERRYAIRIEEYFATEPGYENERLMKPKLLCCHNILNV